MIKKAKLHNRVDRTILIKKMLESPESRTTISFYKYHFMGNPKQFRDELYLVLDAIGTKGRIYTCASGAGVPSTTVLLGGCNSQLVVTGSFVATHINFLRTLGSVRSGNSGESYTSANIAEVFRYSPEEFLAKSPLTNGVAAPAEFDSITQLSPAL